MSDSKHHSLSKRIFEKSLALVKEVFPEECADPNDALSSVRASSSFCRSSKEIFKNMGFDGDMKRGSSRLTQDHQ